MLSEGGHHEPDAIVCAVCLDEFDAAFQEVGEDTPQGAGWREITIMGEARMICVACIEKEDCA